MSHARDSTELDFANAPNFLTLMRILLVPAIIYFLFQKTDFWDLIAGLTFTVAGITDYFDGYLARKQKLETVYGKLMDPLADKFLVVSSLCMLQHLGRIHVVMVILLICREMAITSLRALASSEGFIIGASRAAKWKTTTQMFAIAWLMVNSKLFFGLPLFQMGEVLIWVSLAISLWSAKDYIVDFFVAITEKRRARRVAKKAAKAAKKAGK